MKYKDLPPKLRALIALQSVLAVAAVYLTWQAPSAKSLGLFGFLMLCGAIGGACKVDVNVRWGRLTLGFTVTYFALLLLGTTAAILVGLSGAFFGTILNLKEERRRVNLRRAYGCQSLFNMGNGVVATAVMALVFHALGGRSGALDVQTMGLPILCSALTYYLVNTGLVTFAIAWSVDKDPREVFRGHYAWSWPGYLAGAALSAFFVWSSQAAGAVSAMLLLLPPCYLVYYLFRLQTEKMRADVDHMRETNRLNDAVISSLVMAIDAKDRHTSKHVSRVREYAVRLAEELKVTPDELQAVRIAALLHDIGKIGIPERILCKPGKLTAEEFEIIKSHVEIGAAILEQVQFPWPVVDVVMTHHERWDGLGYPQALKGDAIHIGGRIISLVDVFDALTSDRPYRKAVSKDQAIQVLRANSGTQFDPKVVETFIRLLPEMEVAIQALQDEPDAGSIIDSIAEKVRRMDTTESTDEQDEALVLEALGDLLHMRLELPVVAPRLAERLAELVPYSTFALFLTDEDHRSVVPVHAAGLWTHLVEGTEIRLGEGVSGLVAATGEAEMNAPASLDLARRVRPKDNLELNSTLSVPLLLNGRPVGVLTVYHSGYNFYQPYHLRRLLRVAQGLMETVDPAAWRGGLLPIPQEDAVTRLPNACALYQHLHGQTSLSQTREEEFAVVLLGVEDLRQIQPDRDASWILPAVADQLRDLVRDGDYLARAVGAEFALVIPRCGEREIRPIIQRLLERARSAGSGDGAWPLTLEVGSAVYPQDGASPEALLIAAERRLGRVNPEKAPVAVRSASAA
jgi:putative nucleotidyltransferase with HDIG domain/diguanylate cyclase (GGDEF)-like protein